MELTQRVHEKKPVKPERRSQNPVNGGRMRPKRPPQPTADLVRYSGTCHARPRSLLTKPLAAPLYTTEPLGDVPKRHTGPAAARDQTSERISNDKHLRES